VCMCDPVGIWPTHVYELFDNAVPLYLLCCKYMHVQRFHYVVLNTVFTASTRNFSLGCAAAQGVILTKLE